MPPRYRRDFLLQRALNRCEYCHTPRDRLDLSLQVDHIIAQQHLGTDVEENLAMACAWCNANKGPNISSFDHTTCQIVPLFHPRKQTWYDHFRVENDFLIGLTPTGRVTIDLLNLNSTVLLNTRRTLRLLGTPIGP